jgi:drug/metabolite transporter (DMT)-like permease
MIIVYLIGMTLFGALGGLVLKEVSLQKSSFSKLVYFGFGCFFYGLGAILNVIALRSYPYTVVFPLTSFTYIWTFLISYFYLKEKFNAYKFVGLFLIILGAFVIAK